jgi:hypothetical protein
MRAIALVALLAGCSTQIHTGVVLDCQADDCPSEEAVIAFVAQHTGVSPELDPEPDLTVAWVADPGLGRSGYTDTPRHVAVNGWRALLHERWHVHFWQTTGNPDGDHELGGGPWTVETSEAIERAEVTLRDGPVM